LSYRHRTARTGRAVRSRPVPSPGRQAVARYGAQTGSTSA